MSIGGFTKVKQESKDFISKKKQKKNNLDLNHFFFFFTYVLPMARETWVQSQVESYQRL